MDTHRIYNQWIDINRAALEPFLRWGETAWQTAERVAGDRRPVEQWFELNQAAFEPFLRWNEITFGAAEKLTRRNLSLAQDYIEAGARQINLLSEARDEKQWEDEERKLVSEFGQKIVEHTGDYFRVASETRQAYKDWAEQASKQAAGIAQKATQAGPGGPGQGQGQEPHRQPAGNPPPKA